MVQRTVFLGVGHHPSVIQVLILPVELQCFLIIPMRIQIQGQFVNGKANRLEFCFFRYRSFILIYHTHKGQIQPRKQGASDDAFSGLVFGWVLQLEGNIGIGQGGHSRHTAF